MSPSEQNVINYYKAPESRLGYALLLGGKKHFGYFPEKAGYVSMARAMRIMEDQLAQALGLPAGATVLDAGCGEGGVALHLAEQYGLQLYGVDLLDFNVAKATKKAAQSKLARQAHFQKASYADLPFSDAMFDGAFTMETLVHAVDYRVVLHELYRVTKPGGKLVLFEYSMPARDELTSEQRFVFDTVNRYSAMYSFPKFTHGAFPGILKEAGFECERVSDISERILPMVRRFSWLAWAPYRLARMTHLERFIINAMAGYEFYHLRGIWRYNIVVASKNS